MEVPFWLYDLAKLLPPCQHYCCIFNFFLFFQALKAREILLERLQDHITEKKNAILENISEKNEGVEADEQTNVKTAFDVIIRELILEKLR